MLHSTFSPSFQSLSLRLILIVSIYQLKATTAASIPENSVGKRPPDKTIQRQQFLPFYVPTGSQVVYPSSDPSQSVYEGHDWKNVGIDQPLDVVTTEPGDSLTFTWYGDEIEVYGFRSEESRGIPRITLQLDEAPIPCENVSDYTSGPSNVQQLICRIGNLPFKSHSLKLTHNGARGELLSVHAFVITDRSSFQHEVQPSRPTIRHRGLVGSRGESWRLVRQGNTGVAAMQLTVVSDTHALIIDKVEHNLLTINGHPAWAALYNLDTQEVKPLDLISNSFCAGGTFLGNGTLINVGGNNIVIDKTGATNFGDANGLQSIRFYDPCADGKCRISEFPNDIKLTSARWYAGVTRLPDGSAMIVGGSKKGGWKNNARINNPTIEYFPPKQFDFAPKLPQQPIQSPFLNRTLSSNLFPIVITLPSPDLVFMAANNDAMIYNWKTNVERSLPPIPHSVRVTYPFTGTAVLLPLRPTNNYQAEVLICGGSSLSDTLAAHEVKVSDPASAQCARINLSPSGIRRGWQVEWMPEPRVMPDAILMPDGKVLIINGAQTGTAGYGNLVGLVGQSNADNPNFKPVLYDPRAPEGKRFSSEGMPTSNIARLYHSVATLTPSGQVMIAGSNPNEDRATTNYPTEYQVEWLNPPYINAPGRPAISSFPQIADFGQMISIKMEPFGISKSLLGHQVEVVLIDLGFVTHSVHMNSRLVELRSEVKTIEPNNILARMPTSTSIYPPGFGWIYVLVNGVPSRGYRMMVGKGTL